MARRSRFPASRLASLVARRNSSRPRRKQSYASWLPVCSTAMLRRSPGPRLSASAETILPVTSSCTAKMSVRSRSNRSAHKCPPVVASMSCAVILTRAPEELRELRQRRYDIFRDAVGEIFLLRVAAHVGEGQHGDGGLAGQRGRPLRTDLGLGLDRRGGFRNRQRIDSHRLGNVLEGRRPEIADRQVEPRFHLPIGVFGETDCAGLSDALEARGDVDAVAHQVAVALLDDVADMDADAKFYPAVVRQAGIALHHTALNLDGAAHRIDNA